MDRDTSRAGYRKCYRCLKEFWSSDRTAIRSCGKCQKANDALGGVVVKVCGLARPREVGYRLTEVKR